MDGMHGNEGAWAALFAGRRCGEAFENGAETRIEDAIFNTQVLAILGGIKADIPLAAAQTENVILQQTNQINALAAAAQLANANGFANVKDAVQAGTVLNLQATQNGTKEVLQAICALSDKASADTIAQLRAERAEERAARVADGVRVDVTQNVAQAQQQQQFQTEQRSFFSALAAQLNNIHQGIVQIGAGNVAVPTSTQSNVR